METTFFLGKDELGNFLANNGFEGWVNLENGEFSVNIDQDLAKQALLKEFETLKKEQKFKDDENYQKEYSLFAKALKQSNLKVADLKIPHRFVFNRVQYGINEINQEEREELENDDVFLAILEEENLIIAVKNDD